MTDEYNLTDILISIKEDLNNAKQNNTLFVVFPPHLQYHSILFHGIIKKWKT